MTIFRNRKLSHLYMLDICLQYNDEFARIVALDLRNIYERWQTLSIRQMMERPISRNVSSKIFAKVTPIRSHLGAHTDGNICHQHLGPCIYNASTFLQKRLRHPRQSCYRVILV